MTGLAWWDLARRAALMDAMSMDEPALAVQAALFAGMWTIMMTAMMFPSVAPMLFGFSTVHANRRSRGAASVPVWVFLAGYLTVWAASGLPGFVLSEGIDALARAFPSVGRYGGVAGGLVLGAAGLYQLSRLKYACLSHCRSPMSFILNDWRDGYVGAFRMGLHHGWYCLGCCWLLMATMFALGLMNLAWMGLLALIIFAEKLVPRAQLVSRGSGVAMMAAGAGLVVATGLGA
ncbi:MAG: DUF2182 domain-containing protein [Dehalococcoidia bacterium]